MARPIGFSGASLLGLSKSSELALVLRGNHGSRLDFVNGMLARAPLAGGTPREILQDVRWADWNANGELAVVHHANAHSRLEFPVGHVLYETPGWISHMRFSPDGTQIAFMDHPTLWDDGGSVCVINLQGLKKVLASGWGTEDGLAWSPAGDEVWFTAGQGTATNRSLWAVNMSGKMRKVVSTPGGFELHDIAADGRVLATVESERLAMEWADGDSQKVRDLSWFDWSVAKDISDDGQWVLFEESSEPVGPDFAVALRRVDGSPPIQLGDGSAGGLSPDGKWAISIRNGTPPNVTLLPLGAGQPRRIDLPSLAHLQNSGAHFLPDGRILVVGNEPNRPGRTFVVEAAGGKPKAVTPEGVFASMPSPDGKYLCGSDSSSRLRLYPIEGGNPRDVPMPEPGLLAAQWSADSEALYVYRVGEVPVKVFRLEIASGKLTLVRELVPGESAGVVTISPVVTNYKASQFAYSYYQTLSALYIISGLK
jgi:uncharacterized protein YndB with AHSA1/START domain